MIEPTALLQMAIRDRLIETSAIADLVDFRNIRAGSTRPEGFPMIIIGDGNTELVGNNYTSQRLAWVYLDIHIWAINNGLVEAKKILFEVQKALQTKPALLALDPYDDVVREMAACDHFRLTRSVFVRDPKPEIGHGVLSLEALIRWTI